MQLPDDLPLVSVDPVLVEQALRQIIDNALKYSPPDSTITIAVRDQGESIVVHVTDQGAGPPSRSGADSSSGSIAVTGTRPYPDPA